MTRRDWRDQLTVDDAERAILRAMEDAPEGDLAFLASRVCGLAPTSWMARIASAELARRRAKGRKPTAAETAPCPSEHCSACNGSACWKCGAGLTHSHGLPPCEHDVTERHETPGPVSANRA